MSTRFRFVWSRLSRLAIGFKPVRIPTGTAHQIPKNNNAVPYMLGFSLFTWLGFDKKMTAEDELIHTIKHCIVFIQRTDYEKAEQLLHVALRQAQQIRHDLGITYIYDIMANLALEQEQLNKAKTLFINLTQRIMANGATEDDPRVVHISLKLARISHLQKEYTTAQIGFEFCLEKLKKFIISDPSEDNLKLLALAKDWYGRLYLDTNQLELAAKLMTDALDQMKQVPSLEQEHIVQQLNDIGTVYDRLGNTDKSIAYFQQAINLGQAAKLGDLGTMYVNLGRAYLKQKLLQEARKNCGHGWKLGLMNKNKEVKEEAEECLQEIKLAS